jgi:hypothetical protein
MRKRNLKLTVNLLPSTVYFHAVVATHALASLSSIFLPMGNLFHLSWICAIGMSLCYQLKLYTAHSSVRQICLEGHSAHIKHQTSGLGVVEEFSELFPTVWILPGLCVLYFRLQGKKCMLPIFTDAVTPDDMRKLRTFALRGPLLLGEDSKITG